LLSEPCLGSRIGENVCAAKFEITPSPAGADYQLVRQTGVLKKRDTAKHP
jgi:hypothetical protein